MVAGILQLLLILWLQGFCDCRDIPLSDRPKFCETLMLSGIAQTDVLFFVSLKNKKIRILREFGWKFGGLAAGTHINFWSFLCDFQNRVLLEKNAEKYPCFSLISRKYPEIREKEHFLHESQGKMRRFSLKKHFFEKSRETA